MPRCLQRYGHSQGTACVNSSGTSTAGDARDVDGVCLKGTTVNTTTCLCELKCPSPRALHTHPSLYTSNLGTHSGLVYKLETNTTTGGKGNLHFTEGCCSDKADAEIRHSWQSKRAAASLRPAAAEAFRAAYWATLGALWQLWTSTGTWTSDAPALAPLHFFPQCDHLHMAFSFVNIICSRSSNAALPVTLVHFGACPEAFPSCRDVSRD